MPVIDSERGVLVVRIVYDGPPMSGKTTTVRALSQRLPTGTVSSPEEVRGRTVYFDWLEYVGGVFEGLQVRCQIVSVPGQRELRHRREFLLESADAVVFVGDTRVGAVGTALAMLTDLVPKCRNREPPVGIVFQANKRDAPDAVSRAALRGMLDARAPMMLIDSVATNGEGVREAFVLSVRLALDRVRVLAEAGELPHGAPSENTASELLDRLVSLERRGDPVGPAAVSSEALHDLDRLLPQSSTECAPWSLGTEKVFVPDPLMPSGQIWPPVDGRMLLHEVTRLGLSPVRTARGDWWASGSGWRLHSSSDAVYGDPYEARRQLVGWAGLHAKNSDMLSPRRALILADVGSGAQRMWQLVQVEPSFREGLASATAVPVVLANELRRMAEQLLAARALLGASSLNLRCTLWTVGAHVGEHPRFVGLMPGPFESADSEPDGAELLQREFVPQLQELKRDREDYPLIREHLLSKSGTGLVGRTLADIA